ncbi:MAG: patatin-like phospholipase family protein [Gammaproteobacteria bacterium]|nr:patatin-like phospholipase family protein [Gammaproteobacteria bacterium]
MNPALIARMQAPGPKKLLALDGGGIRGMMTVEVLAEIESLLQQKLGRGDDFVLADYFDFVAGTSTGAIIAACIALGMKVADIRAFYLSSGKEMFDKAFLIKRFRYKYEDEKLAAKMQEIFGHDATLGSDKLRTVLMMVMRNASTDSPWPVSNNPFAKYNQRERDDCNLNIPLWQLVHASTAAPVYFPPEVVQVGQHDFVFVDGGITTFNNPAFQAFLMATMEPYKMNWPVGEDKMLVVSIGTGTSPQANTDLEPNEMNLLYNAGSIPSALMVAALNEQDMLCRTFGNCLAGDALDREVGDLIGVRGPIGPGKLFTYVRYNAELSAEGLGALGLSDIKPEDVQKLDSVEHVGDLQRVGKAVAQKVKPEHFAGFVPGAEHAERFESFKRPASKPPRHKASARFDMLEAEPPKPEAPRVKGGSTEASPVRLGASAPAACRPGDEFTARFVAYPPSDEAEVESVLRKLSPRAETHLGLKQCHWKAGTPVRVSLSGKGLTIDPEVEQFVWEGSRVVLSFDVTVPEATPEGTVVLKFDVAIDGITVARLRMDLAIRAGADKRDIRTTRSRAASSAFASYSKQDRQRVLDRVAALQINTGMDIFMDCLSLHPGQTWKPRLEQEIHHRDLFLLFWSKPASRSKWVEWEWRRALDEGKKDDMEIHPLENDVEPPPELSDLHFADPAMAVRAASVTPP